MSAQAVDDLCLKLARLAATSAFAPHDWRRTWIGELLEVTDLSTAQQVAGHAGPQTMAGYGHPPSDRRHAPRALRAAPRRQSDSGGIASGRPETPNRVR